MGEIERDIEIKVCIGPPCTGDQPENCELCMTVDPFDPDWEANFERQKRGQ